MSTNDSASKSEKSPSIDNIYESAEWNENSDGEIELSFSSMPGRGFGKSIINEKYLSQYIDFLKKIENNEISIEEVSSDDMIEVMKKTMKVDDNDVVSWKTSNGRGSKPTRVRKKDIKKFISFLKTSKSEMKEYSEKYVSDSE